MCHPVSKLINQVMNERVSYNTPDCDEDDEEEGVVAVECSECEERVRRHVLVPLVTSHPLLQLDVTCNARWVQ